MIPRTASALLCVLALTLTGCNKDVQTAVNTGTAIIVNATPEQIAAAAKKAGEAAAKIWVASAKPTSQQKADVSFVLNEIGVATSGYKGGSFVNCLPAVQAAITKSVSDKMLQALAVGLAEGVLVGMDLLFSQHDDWVADGSKAATGVSAFCDGAKSVLK